MFLEKKLAEKEQEIYHTAEGGLGSSNSEACRLRLKKKRDNSGALISSLPYHAEFVIKRRR